MEDNNISPLQSDFEQIKKLNNDGQEYWPSRDLGTALGYSTYQKFTRIINKAISIANNKGLDTAEHFNLMVEMVKLGSGAFRKVENIHLSRMACLIIAENSDNKKPQVQMAREYFKQETPVTELINNSLSSNILLYKTKQGETHVEVIFNSETFWMSQKRMADLFGVDVRTINYHLGQIYESGELTKEATIRKIGIVQSEGERDVERTPMFYNLDAIIAVGYRVNSYQATQFRIWATSVLKEMIVKGFVLDDERLKQGKHFGKDYFDDLLERIREIRASERRYYQKITDVYAECSADYDPKAETTQLFFKMVQNMMHWAVSHQTAAEIIYTRADAEMPHMGLTTWKNAPDGRVQKSDTIVAKNYLSDKEVTALNRLSTAFLDVAELRAERRMIMTMADWKKQLDDFLTLYEYDKLDGAGIISAKQAKEKAYAEYDKFRLIQDKDYLSDFDKEIQIWKDKGLFGND
ncbi:RhuM family protein [Bacteroides clarus]|uniref:Cell filamentation protein Fic n=1 Tax=Bacteroides clarus TaxID=626929 RepID=A0A412N7Q0_9BACE|nr:RhuM family protein [Bacteroides clarus]RGT34226.1 cell filamentation protein Fic [Bacteroides clarus]